MSSATENTVDQKEDKSTTKKNNWSKFKSELISGLTTIAGVCILGGLFLVHTGGHLYLTQKKLNHIKENNKDLWNDIMNITSEKMEGIDIEKTPYTDKCSDPSEESIFSLKNYGFPYKNFFNKHKDWKFNKNIPKWYEKQKPVLYTLGAQLEKTVSGSWSTGRYLFESIRKICYEKAKESKKEESFLIPSMFFWIFGILAYFFYHIVPIYSTMSVIVFSMIYLVFHIIDIFNMPDPPKTPAKKEPLKSQSGGDSDRVEEIKAMGDAVNSVIKEGVSQAAGPGAVAEGAGMMVEKTGVGKGISAIGSSINYCFKLMKEGIIMLFAAVIWFLKRALKSWGLLMFTQLISMLASVANGVIQPVYFVFWFISPLFNKSTRTIFVENILRQKGPIALLLYTVILMSMINNLHDWYPEYMGPAGGIILLSILFGYLK